jgi:hypothetical protein
MIDMLIERLDLDDGDPDFEEIETEDGFVAHPANGPGCPIADQGGGNVEDEGERAAWPERNDQSRFPKRSTGDLKGWHGVTVDEDEEDDDRDSCLAADDDPARRVSDGLPGDSYDTELNGDEGDYGGEVDGV